MTAPYRPPSGSSTERTASVVTIVIGVIALVGVLLVGLVTSDSAGGYALPGQQDSGSGGVANVGGVSGSGGGSAAGGSSGGTGPAVGSSNGTSSGGSGGSSDGTGPAAGTGAAGGSSDGSDLKSNFPTPPGTQPISSYGTLSHPSDEQWYLSTSSLATVNTYYSTTFKARGAVTYVSPSIYRDSSGNPTGYFYIYHFGDTTTVDLSLDANYLDDKPGTVLIRAAVTDD